MSNEKCPCISLLSFFHYRIFILLKLNEIIMNSYESKRLRQSDEEKRKAKELAKELAKFRLREDGMSHFILVRTLFYLIVLECCAENYQRSSP